MSLFQCEVCGCRENTALACQGFKIITESFDWSYAPEREGMLLCSACGPVAYVGNKHPAGFGVWHHQFERIFLPMGEFHTNRVGNLEHTATGNEDYRAYAIERVTQ